MKNVQKKLLSTAILLASSGMAMAGSTTLVSYTPQQIIANSTCTNASLSRGALAIAFECDATNLVPISATSPNGDGNNARDIFIRTGGKFISRVSVNSLGEEARNTRGGVNWYDNNNYADSANANISPDGKMVVFESMASNLDLLTTDSNALNKERDIFVRDLAKKKTYRISGIMDGADGTITAGQLDVFGKAVSSTEAPLKIMTEADNISYEPVIAGTSKGYVAAYYTYASNLIPGMTISAGNTRPNVIVTDLKTKKNELISATHDATGTPLVEANGNVSASPQLSADGRFVVYYSDASNLVSGPTVTGANYNVYIYDRKLYTTTLLSGALGAQSGTGGYAVATEGNDDSDLPSITGGGAGKNLLIAFESRATNLDTVAVPSLDNGTDRDIFVVEFGPAKPKDPNSAYEIKSVKRISAPMDASGNITGESAVQGNGNNSSNRFPVIAGTSAAYTVAFTSSADNLLADPDGYQWNSDSNGATDIYVYNSKTHSFSRANVDSTGQQGTASASNPAIAPDGKGIAFDANDGYLVPTSQLGSGTTGNTTTQVYLRK